MRRIWSAIRIFFRTLFNAQTAEQVDRILSGAGLPPGAEPPRVTDEPAKAPAPAKPAAPAKPIRSEALTLLAALQRDARFVDLVQEPLGNYDDAQIGAAARDVLRDCSSVLNRMFALQPVIADEEGAAVEVPAGFDPNRLRLVGNVAGQPPYSGKLVHHGWQTTKCELPAWTGSKEAANVIAAAEVEI